MRNTHFQYFYVRDYTGSTNKESYTLSITPFSFQPILDNSSDIWSDKKVVWDFGDSTISEDITATHWYKMPGVYDVTMYLYDKNGEAYIDSYTDSVTAHNYISDSFALTSCGTFINQASHIENPFTIIRYNSWQSYHSLSSTGYTFHLFASGSNAPLIDLETYNKDKFGHLKPYAKFIEGNWNELTQSIEYTPVDKVIIDSTEIYGVLSGNSIQLCTSDTANSVLLGTSGSKTLYFVDDLPSPGYLFVNKHPVFLFISQDVANYAIDSKYFNKFPNSVYQLAYKPPLNLAYIIGQQTDISQLKFSSNGLDGDGGEVNLFTVSPIKYTGVKSPFVVRLKSSDDFPTKYYPLLTLISSNSVLSANTIKVVALSGTTIIPHISAITQFGVLSSLDKGGFYKGYIEPYSTASNVRLSATAMIVTSASEVYPTPLAWIASDGSNDLYQVTSPVSYTYTVSSGLIASILSDSSRQMTSLSGAFCFAVIPDNTVCGGYSTWVCNPDYDVIQKITTLGQVISTITLSSVSYNGTNVSLLSTISSAAPSFICVDSNKDIWVTLYDVISTVKFSGANGNLLYAAVPNLNNLTYTLSSNYLTPSLSAYVIGNTVTPSCVGSDSQNNIWVTYSNPASSYIFKFSSVGTQLSAIPLTAGWSASELIVDTNDNVWVTYKDYVTTTPNLSSKRDRILFINSNNGALTAIPLSGSVGNITLDVNQDLWLTYNVNQVKKIDRNTHAQTLCTMPGTFVSYDASISDLEGIGGVSNNKVLVVNNAQKCVDVIDLTINSISATGVPSIYNIQSHGDWTGLNWVSKYGTVDEAETLYISGTSDYFSIYPSTGRYNIGKINENIDFTELYKTNTYQEGLFDNPHMYDDFIGTIVGNISSVPGTLGKRIYEKIANFVDNTYNIDTCDINALKSIFELVGSTYYQFDQYNFNFPAELTRLVNLFSINRTKLWGTRNKFSRNFDKRGNYSSTIFGINIGDELSPATTILTAGSASTPIVAYEKFSEIYTLLNTDLLSSTQVTFRNATTQTYSLSEYNDYWGWGLVLPNNYSSTDLGTYYKFYNYVPTPDNTLLESIINWNDIRTTITENLSTLTEWDDIQSSMIDYELTKGLQLFTSAVDIDT